MAITTIVYDFYILWVVSHTCLHQFKKNVISILDAKVTTSIYTLDLTSMEVTQVID